jgi:hypothetical protein
MNKEAGASASLCHSLMLHFICSKANVSAFSFSSQNHYIFFLPGFLLIYGAPSFFCLHSLFSGHYYYSSVFIYSFRIPSDFLKQCTNLYSTEATPVSNSLPLHFHIAFKRSYLYLNLLL